MGIYCGFEAPFALDRQAITFHDLLGRESLDLVTESALGVGDGRKAERLSPCSPGRGEVAAAQAYSA